MEEKKHKQQGGGAPKSSHTPTRRKLIAPKRSVHIKCTHFPSQIGKRLHSLADRLRFFLTFLYIFLYLPSFYGASSVRVTDPCVLAFFCVGQCGTRLGHRSRITWGCILYSILLLLHLHTKAKILRANLASTSVGNDVVMSGRKNVCGRFVFFFFLCGGCFVCIPPTWGADLPNVGQSWAKFTHIRWVQGRTKPFWHTPRASRWCKEKVSQKTEAFLARFDLERLFAILAPTSFSLQLALFSTLDAYVIVVWSCADSNKSTCCCLS